MNCIAKRHATAALRRLQVGAQHMSAVEETWCSPKLDAPVCECHGLLGDTKKELAEHFGAARFELDFVQDASTSEMTFERHRTRTALLTAALERRRRAANRWEPGLQGRDAVP